MMSSKLRSSRPSVTTSTDGSSDAFGIPKFDGGPVFGDGTGLEDPTKLSALREKALGKSLVDWVRQEYGKCKSSHTSIRNQWYMNLAFFKGDQYVEKINGQVLRTRAPMRRIRLIINRTRPMIRTQLSQMTSQKPSAEVVPNSGEIEDILAAEAAQALFETAMSQYGLRSVYKQAAFWQAVCGVGYVKTFWDKTKDNGIGCFDYSAPSPFHVLIPELLVEDIEDQPYVLNVYTKPIEWVKQVYGKYLPKDHTPTVVGTTEVMETQYLNVKESDRKSEPDSCLFIEAWIKPGTHKDLPQGGLITVCDDILIQAKLDGIPYNHGQYPFTKFDGIPSGSYYHTSSVEDYIQLQMEFNRNRSLRSESRNLTANPAYMAPEGIVDVNKWRAQPGQVVTYKPGMGKPEPLQQPTIPNYVMEEEQAILRDMEDLSGQHQQTRGNSSAGVTSGNAISFLQEADNSFMATVFDAIEAGFQKVGIQTIQLFVQYADVPRMVKITGGNSFSVQMLTGADLKNGTDLRVEPGSSIPQMRAARNAMFMDLMTRGVMEPHEALRNMHIAGMQSYFERTESPTRKAQRENQMMLMLGEQGVLQGQQIAQQMKMQTYASVGLDPQTAQMSPIGGQIDAAFDGPIIPVNPWDNHEAHMAEHEFFMNSEKFESLPQTLRNEYQKHWQAHKDAMMQDNMQMMMSQGQSMGGANGMGGGPGGNNPGGQNQFSGLPPAGDSQQGALDAVKK